MQDMFTLKPVELSDTIYSETVSSIEEAHENNDIYWAAELYIEAFTLLRDQGLVDDNRRVSAQRYPELLWECHLDAQVTDTGDNE